MCLVSKTKTAWITGTVVHPHGRKLVKHKRSFTSAIASSSRTQFVLLGESGIQRVRRRFGLPLELACKTPVGLCSPKDGILCKVLRWQQSSWAIGIRGFSPSRRRKALWSDRVIFFDFFFIN
jgi:hypothetical protein